MAGRVVHDLALVDDREFNPGADPDKPAMVEPSFWERLKSVFTGSDPAPATTAEPPQPIASRSEEHTSELQSLMRISYAVFCLKKKNKTKIKRNVLHRHISYISKHEQLKLLIFLFTVAHDVKT